MSLVLNAFAGSWDRFEAYYYIAYSVSTNYAYMGMWSDTRKPILLKGITRLGGGQGDAHRTLGCGKSMPPAGSHSVWEGSLHGDSRGMTARGWRRRVAEATQPPV